MKKLVMTLTLSILMLSIVLGGAVACGDNSKAASKTYNLKTMTVKMTGVADYVVDLDNMSEADKGNYDSAIALYGKTVKISATTITFSGITFAAFNPAAYTLNGTSVVFTKSDISSTFNNVTLSQGIFSLGISNGSIGYSFEYKL